MQLVSPFQNGQLDLINHIRVIPFTLNYSIVAETLSHCFESHHQAFLSQIKMVAESPFCFRLTREYEATSLTGHNVSDL